MAVSNLIGSADGASLLATLHLRLPGSGPRPTAAGEAPAKAPTSPATPGTPSAPVTPAGGAKHTAPVHPLGPPAADLGNRAAAGPAPAGVTVEQVVGIMTHCPRARAQRYLDPMNRGMHEFHIDSRLRRCAFLAQIAEESGELQWFHELASGWEYDLSTHPRKARELGNTQPGDGPRYKGRGPIQLTGRGNYRKTGKALGLDLEGNPEIAVEPGIAFRTSCYFWESHGLNALADEGNLREITHRINGGYTHYDVRLAFYEKALVVIKA